MFDRRDRQHSRLRQSERAAGSGIRAVLTSIAGNQQIISVVATEHKDADQGLVVVCDLRVCFAEDGVAGSGGDPLQLGKHASARARNAKRGGCRTGAACAQ